MAVLRSNGRSALLRNNANISKKPASQSDDPTDDEVYTNQEDDDPTDNLPSSKLDADQVMVARYNQGPLDGEFTIQGVTLLKTRAARNAFEEAYEHIKEFIPGGSDQVFFCKVGEFPPQFRDAINHPSNRRRNYNGNNNQQSNGNSRFTRRG